VINSAVTITIGNGTIIYDGSIRGEYAYSNIGYIHMRVAIQRNQVPGWQCELE
jgi:hypothetical protein